MDVLKIPVFHQKVMKASCSYNKAVVHYETIYEDVTGCRDSEISSHENDDKLKTGYFVPLLRDGIVEVYLSHEKKSIQKDNSNLVSSVQREMCNFNICLCDKRDNICIIDNPEHITMQQAIKNNFVSLRKFHLLVKNTDTPDYMERVKSFLNDDKDLFLKNINSFCLPEDLAREGLYRVGGTLACSGCPYRMDAEQVNKLFDIEKPTITSDGTHVPVVEIPSGACQRQKSRPGVDVKDNIASSGDTLPITIEPKEPTLGHALSESVVKCIMKNHREKVNTCQKYLIPNHQKKVFDTAYCSTLHDEFTFFTLLSGDSKIEVRHYHPIMPNWAIGNLKIDRNRLIIIQKSVLEIPSLYELLYEHSSDIHRAFKEKKHALLEPSSKKGVERPDVIDKMYKLIVAIEPDIKELFILTNKIENRIGIKCIEYSHKQLLISLLYKLQDSINRSSELARETGLFLLTSFSKDENSSEENDDFKHATFELKNALKFHNKVENRFRLGGELFDVISVQILQPVVSMLGRDYFQLDKDIRDKIFSDPMC